MSIVFFSKWSRSHFSTGHVDMYMCVCVGGEGVCLCVCVCTCVSLYTNHVGQVFKIMVLERILYENLWSMRLFFVIKSLKLQNWFVKGISSSDILNVAKTSARIFSLLLSLPLWLSEFSFLVDESATALKSAQAWGQWGLENCADSEDSMWPQPTGCGSVYPEHFVLTPTTKSCLLNGTPLNTF